MKIIMKLHVSKLKDVIADALDTIVLPSASFTQKAMITFVFAQNITRLDELTPKIAFILNCDKDGYIDLDKTYENAKLALEKADGKLTIPLLNWDLDKDDLDKIFEIAKSKGV